MSRIRRSGSFTAVIDDQKKEISLRQQRPDPGKIVLTGDQEKARAVKEMKLDIELKKGYELVEDS